MFDYFNVPYHDDVYFTKAMEASIAEGTNSEVLY
jgi:hypothetical protein